MRPIVASLLVLSLVSRAAPAFARDDGPRGVASVQGSLTLSDGTQLTHTLVHPSAADAEGPWPVILVRTPYGRGGAADAARALVERGAAILVHLVGAAGSMLLLNELVNVAREVTRKAR